MKHTAIPILTSTLILCILSGNTFAADAPATRPALTPEEAKQIESAKFEAMKMPEVRAANEKFIVARKAYQAERRKFPADRVSEPTLAYRKATRELADVTRAAILKENPALAPLLDKTDALETAAARRKPNEGETTADSDARKNPAIRAIKDVPGLPRVLLIGDSISIGYTLQVRELLKGKANVHRIPINGGATEVGLAKMKDWLGDSHWDVIHFNFGVHDAKYMSATQLRASPEQYEKNLRALVAQMRATGAKLIFATTTPVPDGGILSPTRKFDSITNRNEIAIRVMKETGVALDDLYAVVLPVQDKIQRPHDVHFTSEGYDVLAKAVAGSIEAQLPGKP